MSICERKSSSWENKCIVENAEVFILDFNFIHDNGHY